MHHLSAGIVRQSRKCIRLLLPNCSTLISYRLVDKTLVSITVGKDIGEEETFSLHREYLVTVSKYFKNMFKGSFREKKDKNVSLDDVDPMVFKIFIEWLHGRKVLDIEGNEYKGDIYDCDCDVEEDSFGRLIHLYIFSDQYDIPQLRRDALDAFINFSYACPHLCPPNLIGHVYENLPSKSPMLRFLVDEYVCFWSGELSEGSADLPAPFLLEVARTFCVYTRKTHKTHKGIEIFSDPCRRSLDPYGRLCDYHEHGQIEV